MMMGQQAQPGQQGKPGQMPPPADGQPMLLAPVPGGPKPDPNGPVMITQGENPPDSPPQSTIAMTGSGQQPGMGRAELNNTPTQKQQTSHEDVVQAQQNNQGQSSVRSVEGGPRTEQSTQGATQTTLEAIQAEEEALDEAALPPARREQVRRYFNELRKRFEKE